MADIFDKWIFIYAVVVVSITELVIRTTPEYISRRRFGAIFSVVLSFLVASVHGMVLEYRISEILWRTLLTLAFSNCGYDHLKTYIGEFIKGKGVVKNVG